MKSAASRRGAANRARGVRFERYIARKLRAAGFECRRYLEYDGIDTGVDLVIGRRHGPTPDFIGDKAPAIGTCYTEWFPVAIQCKSTANPADLTKGLHQAMDGRFSAEVWMCFHSRPTATRRREIVVQWLSEGGASYRGTLDQAIVWLAKRYLSPQS